MLKALILILIELYGLIFKKDMAKNKNFHSPAYNPINLFRTILFICLAGIIYLNYIKIFRLIKHNRIIVKENKELRIQVDSLTGIKDRNKIVKLNNMK